MAIGPKSTSGGSVASPRSGGRPVDPGVGDVGGVVDGAPEEDHLAVGSIEGHLRVETSRRRGRRVQLLPAAAVPGPEVVEGGTEDVSLALTRRRRRVAARGVAPEEKGLTQGGVVDHAGA